MAMRGAEGPAKIRRPVYMVPRANGPALTQPTFDWKAQNKYNELNNFRTEARNIFIMNSYSIEE